MASTAFISAVLSPRLDAASGENLRQKAGLRLRSEHLHESDIQSDVYIAECQPHGTATAMLEKKKRSFLKYNMNLWYFALRILLESLSAISHLHFPTCFTSARALDRAGQSRMFQQDNVTHAGRVQEQKLVFVFFLVLKHPPPPYIYIL